MKFDIEVSSTILEYIATYTYEECMKHYIEILSTNECYNGINANGNYFVPNIKRIA